MENVISSTDTYLSLLFNLPNLSPNAVLSTFFLLLGRILPIMAITPFFGAKTVPAPVRIMFSISLIAILLPQLLLSMPPEIPFNFAFTLYFLKEVAIGFILGFLASVPFYIAQSSGSLIDHIRGSSSLQVTDPTTSSQTGTIGIFYNYLLIVIFFFIGGPFFFLEALGRSFILIPIHSLINPIFFSPEIPFWHTIIGLLTHVLSLAIQLGAPAIIGILMADIFLGVANRLAPQVQIVFLGISLKSWLGLALLAAAWYFILQQLGKESLDWIKVMEKTIQQAAPRAKI